MKVSSFMIIGFIYLLTATLPATAQGTFYTIVSRSNVHTAPTTNSFKIGVLQPAKRVLVLGDAAGGKWYRVQLASGQVGFMYHTLLRPLKGAVQASKSMLTGGPTPAQEDAFAYIVWPNDGDIIPRGEFVIMFGLHGMGVAPAEVTKDYTGHHHLLIDTDLPALDEPIPNDDNHVHFGRGQTEYLVQLPRASIHYSYY